MIRLERVEDEIAALKDQQIYEIQSELSGFRSYVESKFTQMRDYGQLSLADLPESTSSMTGDIQG